jgi:hypothetical protein
VIKPRLRIIQAILREAAARGEIDSGSAIPLITRTGPAVVLQAILLTGQPPKRAELGRNRRPDPAATARSGAMIDDDPQ